MHQLINFRSAETAKALMEYLCHLPPGTWHLAPGTWHREAGTPTHELQRLGGWKTQSMVKRYAHVAPEGLQLAASRLPYDKHHVELSLPPVLYALH